MRHQSTSPKSLKSLSINEKVSHHAALPTADTCRELTSFAMLIK